MRSKARIASHPVHPMLIPFPIAFFIGALVADIVTKSNGSPSWFYIGYVLTIAGVLTALVAAVPGMIDYFTVVPGRSQTKRHATIHMGLNLAVVALFFVSYLIKNHDQGFPLSWSALILEIVGVIGLGFSGWLGGTLVYKDHVGIETHGEMRSQDREAHRRVA